MSNGYFLHYLFIGLGICCIFLLTFLKLIHLWIKDLCSFLGDEQQSRQRQVSFLFDYCSELSLDTFNFRCQDGVALRSNNMRIQSSDKTLYNDNISHINQVGYLCNRE